jgi:hypothetical protein
MKSFSLYIISINILGTHSCNLRKNISAIKSHDPQFCFMQAMPVHHCGELRTLRHMAMSVKSSQAVYYPLLPRRSRIQQLKLPGMKDRGKELEHCALAPEVPAGRPLCKKE